MSTFEYITFCFSPSFCDPGRREEGGGRREEGGGRREEDNRTTAPPASRVLRSSRPTLLTYTQNQSYYQTNKGREGGAEGRRGGEGRERERERERRGHERGENIKDMIN